MITNLYYKNGHNLKGLPPEYNIIHREGPDHQPIFTIKLTIKDQKEIIAKGASRRIAEQKAAELFYLNII